MLYLENQKINYKLYGRRKGRKSFSSKDISFLNKNLFCSEKIKNKKIILDIGFGYGESTLYLSSKYKNSIIIAIDVYKDGIINLSKKIRENKINNIIIFNQNALFLFDKKNIKKLISEIWIFFPDPWSKKKHNKRRLVNKYFINKINFFLKKDSKIYITTDSRDYLISILDTFSKSKHYLWINEIPYKWDYAFNKLPDTKYYKKSLINKRKSFFLHFQKI
ncbi:MAG: tRNA (guanine-N(7)-)-methyltransferase [Alphaproteobacteria bacterium MarineAlpha5_Bin9]|nr:MAG: tRNA (guanine-N(7)-)-methyltransferase [Alphaproteobacteria bacterium MarineAlpha5_Bin9]|tara:strand:+ start:7316 stop:7975 length:660 start_codon:yes stop_codon:yes gene_type:complete